MFVIDNKISKKIEMLEEELDALKDFINKHSDSNKPQNEKFVVRRFNSKNRGR